MSQLDLFGGTSPTEHRLARRVTSGMVERPEQRDTSAASASAIAPLTGTLREKVLHAIVRAGERGLTDEEGIELTGIVASTYRPRRVELADGWKDFDGGFIVDSERRRKTRSGRSAAVWIATERGRRSA